MPIHLHAHSWYSLLEAVPSPAKLLERAAACGYTALALTDSNNLYGAAPFVKQAVDLGIRPLLGACLRQHRQRCVALIADTDGYRNLCRILSRLHLAILPRAGSPGPALAELLAENAQGLHVLVDDAVLAERLREAFGARLWLEVIRPPRSPRHEQEVLALGQRLGLALVASTAVHLATPEDYPAFRRITAVRQTTLLDRLPRQLSITPAHHLVDAAALRHRFRDLPEAVRNTDVLADQLRSDVLPHKLVLPPPRIPRHLDALPYLRLLCERGLRRRDLGDHLDARQRLREELTLIEGADLAGYFLVVRGIARYARQRGHSMALRGSAGSSLVCFLLEITDVNPLSFDLSLERFLHAGRADLPDIDLDFDWKVRDDVIAHVFRRYGPQHTAMISSHLFLQPRSAFREAAKIHGLSNEQISRLLESVGSGEERAGVPPPPGFPLEAERWPRILADTRLLLGRPHHLSIHPGGVVITPRPIEEYVPLQVAPKGIVITQFDKDAIENVGLVKIDLLGNRALATVDEAVLRLRLPPDCSGKGNHPRLTISDRDPATVDLVQRGDTLGVNQLESPAMRHLLIQMKPDSVNEVIQALAMIRPGAASIGMKECFIRRRRGLEPVRHAHPNLEPALRETHGLMLYEDDALSVIQALTGLSAPVADHFRKRISKHQTEDEARALAEEFLRSCTNNGVAWNVAAELWVQLAKFNRYSFCKSHAVSYGLIAWKAAYLKAHHPLPFWTAALNNNQGMYPRRVYVEAIKRGGIRLLLPCINRSAGPFIVDQNAIRVGLDAIASLGEELCRTILAERERHGPYLDLAGFRRRVHPGPEALALLIRCGALDYTGRPRPALFLEAELQDRSRDLDDRMFPDETNLEWSPADYASERRLRDEWDLLSFLVGPPLFSLYRGRLPRGIISSRELPEHVGQVVRVAGLVATGRHTEMEDGRVMQFVSLEDEWGQVDVTLFPGTCPPVPYLALGPYLVTGMVEEQYDVLTVTAHRFERVR